MDMEDTPSTSNDSYSSYSYDSTSFQHDPDNHLYTNIGRAIGDMNLEMPGHNPYLIVTEEPQDKFRFRYPSEMHGTHGCIVSLKKHKLQKIYPTVKLCNWKKEAVIRCSLYTTDEANRKPHPHLLVAKHNSMPDKNDHHEQVVPVETSSTKKNRYEVDFPGIGILHTAKRHVKDYLEKKYTRIKRESIIGRELTMAEKTRIRDEAENDSKSINLNSVCLCFEAFVKKGEKYTPICEPVYSVAIHNMKCASTGELRICRIDRVAGSCKGGDEVFIFVEKVNKKNIKIRFFELGEEDEEIWSDWARFNESDVHHQYAISFRTPPYKTVNLDKSVEVFMELKRPSDNLVSEPKAFLYKPCETDLYGPHKRMRHEEEIEMYLSACTGPTPPSVASATFQKDFKPEVVCSEPPDQLFQEDGDFNMPSIDCTIINTAEFPPFTTPSFEQFLQKLNDYSAVDQQSSSLIENQMSHEVTYLQAIVPDAATIRIKNNSRQEVAQRPNQKPNSKGEDIPLRVLQGMQNALDIGMDAAGLTSIFSDFMKKEDSEGSNAFHILLLTINMDSRNMEKVDKLIQYSRQYLKKEDALEIVRARNNDGLTVLYLSILMNVPKLVEFCLHVGSDINRDECNGKSPLFLAVDTRYTDCLKQMLDFALKAKPPVDLNMKNDFGQTVLHVAVRNGNINVVTLLLNAGVDINKPDSDSGATALHLAVEKGSGQMVELLLLQEAVATLTKVDVSGLYIDAGDSFLRMTHSSLTDKNSQVLSKALKKVIPASMYRQETSALDNINVNVQNSSGDTPLHLACLLNGKGCPKITQLLLEAKADPWIENFDSEREELCGSSDDIQIKEEMCSDEELEMKGKTAFDIAKQNPMILQILHRFQTVKLEDDDEIWEEASSEIPDKTIILDKDTLKQVADIIEQNGVWRDLAESMGLEDTIKQLELFKDPALKLLAGCMDQITTDELKDLLIAHDQMNAVQIIDAMIAAGSSAA